jgi:hypothetical protein
MLMGYRIVLMGISLRLAAVLRVLIQVLAVSMVQQAVKDV